MESKWSRLSGSTGRRPCVASKSVRGSLNGRSSASVPLACRPVSLGKCGRRICTPKSVSGPDKELGGIAVRGASPWSSVTPLQPDLLREPPLDRLVDAARVAPHPDRAAGVEHEHARGPLHEVGR